MRVPRRILVRLVALVAATAGAGGGASFAVHPASFSTSAAGAKHVAAADPVPSSTPSGDPTPAPEPPASSVTTSSTGDSPPVVTPVITGTQGTGGWYVTDVRIEWKASDDETPVTSTQGCDPADVTQDTNAQTFTCTATSDGGTTTANATIARDATAPADVVALPDRPANERGWYTTPFTVTWSGTDATSGIATCTQTKYEGPDTPAGSIAGDCTDKAGNTSASVAFAFAYDATAPVVHAVASRDPDANGWYNHAVTMTWVSDGSSDTCDPPVTYEGPDTSKATLKGGCIDVAGNRGEVSFDLRYDATAPVIQIVSPSAPSYVLHQLATVHYTCADATSGPASCTGSAADGSALDTNTIGQHSVSVDATDQAGNHASSSASYAVVYNAAGALCGGVAGHQILSPIAVDGSSTAQGNSTVPAKFRVCDFFGKPVTSSGVVTSFVVASIDGAASNSPVPSTTPHEQFRAGDSQWIFNISTKTFRRGSAYAFHIALNDGTAIDFGFHIR